MAKTPFFWYNIPMRSLCISLAVLAFCAVALTSSPEAMRRTAPLTDASSIVTWREAASRTKFPEAKRLLHEIERIRVAGNPDECDALEPIPLEEGAPSALDWAAYCRERSTGDAGGCLSIPATIDPPLRALCAEPR
jgi:hypothetical protein